MLLRRLALLTVAGVSLAAAGAAAVAGEYDKPIPQNPEQRKAQDERILRFSQRSISEPYEKIGNRDPRWDEKVRVLLALATKLLSGPVGKSMKYSDVFARAKDAVDAGCDDPMVLYLYARTSLDDNYPGDAEYDRRMTAAAVALEKSKYPPIRRASALVNSALMKAGQKDDDAARKEAARMTEAALALLPESVEVDGTSAEAFEIWFIVAQNAYSVHKALTGESQAAFDKVDEALTKAATAKLLRLQFKAWFLTQYAWEARGNGFAGTVTEDGFRKFAARLEETRKVVEEAWALRPGDGHTARLMLPVELGMGEGDRDRMELWFKRAMEGDSDDLRACREKLNWLEPKWHGSFEAMMDFARACRDTKNWRSGIPLLLPEAHFQMRCYLDPKAKEAYFLDKPEVWKDIYEVYTEYLKRFPDDHVARSEAAAYSYLCGRATLAHQLFEMLGEHLAPSEHFTLEYLKQARQHCAEAIQAAEAAAAEKPPAPK